MSRSDDDGYAISYKVLETGTAVHSSDGVRLGSVRQVLENVAEHIFDGLVIDTPDGQRFVDAPEIARIAELRVTLTLDAIRPPRCPNATPRVDRATARMPAAGA